MLDSLLSTKLYIPQVSQKVVHRPRLTERLNRALDEGAKMTLVSAPAGYGKTTLVAQWLSDLAGEKALTVSPAHRVSRSQIAWLSLDKADNDIARFFGYLIAALQVIDQEACAEIQPILETDADLPIEPLLTSLVNDVAAWGIDSQPGKRYVLVLDDYHLISEFSIHEAVDFLVDHIPPCLHLVIMTRVDPPMPLGRLRVQGALLEIREVDLRFRIKETTAFLNELMGLDLTAESVKTLEARTEGWIAGLQLAALTLQGRTDKQELVNAYSGSHRHLVDYLAHEVLSRQTEEVQSFLMRISILDRFNASLCDGVLEHRESSRILGYLEQANLFLVPLDSERQWYRFHNLFADFLRQRLRESQPENISVLFNRASQWYETQDELDEAITYAIRSGDVERAANLLDVYVEPLMLLSADIAKVLEWAERIPEEIRAKFPRLCIYHAWALQFEFQLESVEPSLALAEAHLEDPDSLPDSFSASQISGHASAIRSYMAYRKGDFDQNVELSLAALRTLPKETDTKEDALVRGAITLGLGMSYMQLGDLDAAYQAIQSSLPMNQKAGNRYAALSCIENMMWINDARGALNQVAGDAERGLWWIEDWSGKEGRKSRPGRMLANLRRGLGRVQYERNELDQAAVNLKKACDYFEMANSWLRLENYAYMIDLYSALADVDKALDYYNKLKRFYLRHRLTLPGIPLGAFLAQRNLMLGQSLSEHQDLIVEAVRWAENSDLKSTDDFRYEREYEYHILAFALIAEQRAQEAVPLLDRLIISAEEGGRNGDLILYLSLHATAHHSLGESDLALTHLSRALKLAEPEGYIRTFVDLGSPMRDLLHLTAGKDFSPSYVAKLLSAFPEKLLHGTRVPDNQRPAIPALQIETLNEREMQILRLISARLSNREIAEELYLSVNTVKWYASSIYDKLGVANRREAGSRARDLRLL